MPRLKGSGNGTISLKDGKWVGRWYRWRTTEDGRLVQTRPEKVLGLASELNREQAAQKLKFIVDSERLLKGSRKRRALTCDWNIVPATPAVDFSQRTGAVAEMVVSIDLLRNGFEVFKAVCHSASCDLLAIKEGALHRVEVKYIADAKTTASTLRWKLFRNMGKFDLCAFVSSDWSVEYVPATQIAERVEMGGLKQAGVNEAEGRMA